jgi:hypothetical protein
MYSCDPPKFDPLHPEAYMLWLHNTEGWPATPLITEKRDQSRDTTTPRANVNM